MALLATVTQAGMLAALTAGAPGGPVININSFKIGSVAAFAPDDTMTTVNGEVYIGASNQMSYFVQDASTVRFRISLDNNVGDFAVGNIGLFLLDGTMFAIASLPGPTFKVRDNFPTQAGNTKVFDIILHYSNLSTLLTYSVSLANYADLPEVANEAALPSVLASPHINYLVKNWSVTNTPAMAYLNTLLNVWALVPLTNKAPIYSVATGSTTVGSLPSAVTSGAGFRHFVTDATATTFHSIVVGGGTNKVPVVSDGANRLIG